MSKLILIVPYRNRPQQKEEYIKKINQFCNEKGIDYYLYIIEQSEGRPFNRGCLFNIGFLESQIDYDSYYCFSDIDVLPKTKKAEYLKPEDNYIVHPYGHLHSLSCLTLINSETFKKINGYSNKYWGWGFEDDDFLLRAYHNGVRVDRTHFTERFKSNLFYELDQQNISDLAKKMGSLEAKINQILFYSTVINPHSTKIEGINSVEYKIISKSKSENYTNIQCEICNKYESERQIVFLRNHQSYLNSLINANKEQ